MAESRVEDLLETGVEQPVVPMSEIEAILRGEPVTPHSRIAELLLKYNPSDILIEKRITENGTYFATNDNADGYYKVVVDEYVPTLILKQVTQTYGTDITYNPSSDNADGYSSVRVTVPDLNLELIGLNITSNGLSNIQPSPGYDAIGSVALNVDVQPNVEAKSITTNGTHTAAADGVDGYSRVAVNVQHANVRTKTLNATSNDTYTPPTGITVVVSVPTIPEETWTAVEFGGASTHALTSYDFITVSAGGSIWREYPGNVATYSSGMATKNATCVKYTDNSNYIYVAKLIESGEPDKLMVYRKGITVSAMSYGTDNSYYSQVSVNVPGQNADLVLRCVGLDGYSVTITSADNSETYTKSVTGSPATITFDNLAYVGNWTVSNTKDSTTVTVSNAVSNEDYKLYTQQIPRMTAYDQPSGVISASSEYDERFLAWFAAANNGGSGGNGWMGASMNSYLIYQFATPVIFSKLYFYIADVWGFDYYNIREYGNDIDVLGSVDGTTYERCTSTGSTVNKKGYGDVNIDLNGKKYKYLKVIVPKATFNRDYYNCGVMNLMLYSDPEATAYMLGSKSITANGTYNPASDGLDAFSEVTVNIPNSLKGALERTVSVIDDNVLESIGAYAFFSYGKQSGSIENLTSVKFRNATSIGQNAFQGCTSLTNVDIPKVTSINNSAFSSCASLTDVDFPNATSIGGSAFQGCTSLTNVDFPNATSIGTNTFSGCASLANVDIPKVESIGANAFNNCTSLTNVDFHNATSIGQGAFSGCTSLTDVDFPNATSIGVSIFQGCASLANVDIPKVTSIGSYVFSGCASLTDVDFPKVTSISSSAFYNCTSLDTLILRKSDAIVILSNINAFNNTPFASGGTGGTLYVPQALISSYQSASNWSTILGYPNNQIKPIEGSIYE